MLLSCLKRDCVMGEIRCAKYSKEDTLELRVRFVVLQLLTNCWAELTAGFEIRQTSGRSRKRIKRGEMVISGTYCDVASQSMFFQFFPDIHPFPGIRMLLFSWNFAGEFKWAISRLLGEQGIQRQGEWIVSGEDTSRWGRDPLLVPADSLATPSDSVCVHLFPASLHGLYPRNLLSLWFGLYLFSQVLDMYPPIAQVMHMNILKEHLPAGLWFPIFLQSRHHTIDFVSPY